MIVIYHGKRIAVIVVYTVEVRVREVGRRRRRIAKPRLIRPLAIPRTYIYTRYLYTYICIRI